MIITEHELITSSTESYVVFKLGYKGYHALFCPRLSDGVHNIEWILSLDPMLPLEEMLSMYLLSGKLVIPVKGGYYEFANDSVEYVECQHDY